MPVSYDLSAPTAATVGPPLPRRRPAFPPVEDPAAPPPFGWRDLLRTAGTALADAREAAPPVEPAAPSAPYGFRDLLRTAGEAVGGARDMTRDMNARGMEPLPPGLPTGSFSPLPGGGYATPSAPWTGPPSPGAAPPPPSGGYDLNAIRSFYGAPPDMSQFIRTEHRGPNVGRSQIDPGFASAMAAYNQGVNAFLNRGADQERVGMGMTGLLGLPGTNGTPGVPGSLATGAREAEARMRAAESQDRTAASQWGPQGLLAQSYQAFHNARTQAGDTPRQIDDAWRAAGRRLPEFAEPIVHPGNGPPLTGPDSPAAVDARVRNILTGARRLSAPWVIGARDPRAVTTGTGATAWRGRERERLLRDQGVPEEIIQALAQGNFLATGGGGIPGFIEGGDPGLSIDEAMRRLAAFRAGQPPLPR